MADPIEQTADALLSLIAEAGGVDVLITPRGWRHMGLVIIDAVFSLRAQYDGTVKPLVIEYCTEAPGLSWDRVSDMATPEHGAQQLVDFLGPMSLGERAVILSNHIGPGTARRGSSGKRKVEIVVEIAQILLDWDPAVSSRRQFETVAVSDPKLEQSVIAVRGVGFACWKYMLSLSEIEVCKPDTMVLKWLDRALGARTSPVDGAMYIEQATALLQDRGIPVTVRQMDHLVWRKESGRPLTASQT